MMHVYDLLTSEQSKTYRRRQQKHAGGRFVYVSTIPNLIYSVNKKLVKHITPVCLCVSPAICSKNRRFRRRIDHQHGFQPSGYFAMSTITQTEKANQIKPFYSEAQND